MINNFYRLPIDYQLSNSKGVVNQLFYSLSKASENKD